MKIFLSLAFILVTQSSFAGFPPFTDINPNNITVGQEVFIGFDPLQTPCLQGLPNFQGLTEFVEIDANNFIDITIVALGTSPCLNIGVENPPYQYYSLGVLPEGDYTVQMYWTDNSVALPVTDPLLRLAIGDLLQFRVGSPTPVPTLNILGLMALLSLSLIIAGINLRKAQKRTAVLLLLLLFSTMSYSKKFHIQLSAEEGAPTAEELINQATTSPSPPAWLLDSFNQASPSEVEYLIKERPVGNRLIIVDGAPNWAMSQLYRYLIVTYPDSVDENTILSNFQNDVDVTQSAWVDNLVGSTSSFPNLSNKSTNRNLFTQNSFKGIGTNFLTDLNISQAWELSEGMGYIGALDVGLQIDHPDLKAFDGGVYQGGNILDGFYQIDIGEGDLNVDEQEPYDTQGIPAYEPCDLEDGVDDNLATSIFVGHGTHLTGIMVGSDHSIGGICKNCGMSMMKITSYDSPTNSSCINYNGVNTLIFGISPESSINALTILTNVGIGTVNWSGGFRAINEFYCVTDTSGLCLAVDFMKQQNTLMVGASGNHRAKLQFPASEVGTVAVGGLDESGGFWNESPNNGDPFDFTDVSNCPRGGIFNECGTNISHLPTNQKLDVMTQAKAVYSTFYEGGEWADDLNCTDFQDGSIDAYGFCTGTSMSSPQVAAILQLMRSAHPLLPNGTSDPTQATGLINVLNSTASRYTGGLGLNDFLGYGLPDARLALERILGVANGNQIKTRLSPMFAVTSSEDENNVYTSFPQVAMAFLLNNGAEYLPDTNAPLVDEFTEFWYDTANLSFPPPRAHFYVFTTNNNPFVNLKNMVPLRRMEKSITGSRNDTYAVNTTEIETFKADGYNLAGIEGYIFPTCDLEPGCIPAGAQKLYRVVDDVNFNHTLVNLPINDPAPSNSTKIGYVYPNIDTDGDGLIDGQELILGTSTTNQDSDGDDLPDGLEYPPAGVPFSDPLISDIIFEDGFE